ncbi:NUDIX hydrolase [Bacillus sp. JCM 19041]|uniref:NUDIX hydrolase n=1 Tax=Bacillus sp. JCM 19041 TaxID=1460637 RepID=UPI0006D2A669
MKKWYGASAICINSQGQLLMVLQGKPDEVKTWSVPSGEREEGETFEACCERETKEETGCTIKVKQLLMTKKHVYPELEIEAEVHYFIVELIDSTIKVDDPDQLIMEAKWQPREALEQLQLSFPEDLSMLKGYLDKWKLEKMM